MRPATAAGSANSTSRPGITASNELAGPVDEPGSIAVNRAKPPLTARLAHRIRPPRPQDERAGPAPLAGTTTTGATPSGTIADGWAADGWAADGWATDCPEPSTCRTAGARRRPSVAVRTNSSTHPTAAATSSGRATGSSGPRNGDSAPCTG